MRPSFHPSRRRIALKDRGGLKSGRNHHGKDPLTSKSFPSAIHFPTHNPRKNYHDFEDDLCGLGHPLVRRVDLRTASHGLLCLLPWRAVQYGWLRLRPRVEGRPKGVDESRLHLPWQHVAGWREGRRKRSLVTFTTWTWSRVQIQWQAKSVLGSIWC